MYRTRSVMSSCRPFERYAVTTNCCRLPGSSTTSLGDTSTRFTVTPCFSASSPYGAPARIQFTIVW